MTPETQHAITYKVLFGILIIIIGFFGAAYFNKLNEIQKDLVSLQIKVAEIQSSIMTRQDVKEMIRDEVQKYHFIKDNNK